MISDSHKFIFLHVGKCAGTSIKEAMKDHPLVDVYHCEDLSYDHPTLQNMENMVKGHGHDPHDYFKFSVTRNPWDRMVSLYYHMLNLPTVWIYPHMGERLAKGGKRPDHDELVKMQFTGSFEEFIDSQEHTSTVYSGIDFVVRYENLKEDFNHVCSCIKIDSYELPHIHYNTGRSAPTYREYYNDKTRERVADMFAENIKLFNYTF